MKIYAALALKSRLLMPPHQTPRAPREECPDVSVLQTHGISGLRELIPECLLSPLYEADEICFLFRDRAVPACR